MRHIALLLEQYGLVVVFFNVLVSQGGTPVPMWPVLLLAGALSIGGGAPWPAVLGAAVAGAILADIAWYIAGGRYGRRVLGVLCKVSLSPDSCVRQTEAVFGRFGPLALLFAKFVPGLGYVTVALSGVTGVFFPMFVLLDVIGAAVYFTIPILLGRIFTMPSTPCWRRSWSSARMAFSSLPRLSLPGSSFVGFSGSCSSGACGWTASRSMNSYK